MAIFKTMTTRERWSVAISILWMLFGLYMTTRITWVGVGWVALGILALASTFRQARKHATPAP